MCIKKNNKAPPNCAPNMSMYIPNETEYKCCQPNAVFSNFLIFSQFMFILLIKVLSRLDYLNTLPVSSKRGLPKMTKNKFKFKMTLPT